ncbi:MAG: ATP-binding protein [Actinobacteria bacterium]|nr:ATP-binding protein [Actinomycetota bacterium]
MPSLDQRLELPAQPTSARRARRFVGEILRSNGADGASDVCVLLTSELVTNAVLYARSPIVLRVALDASLVRVSVHDDSPTPPSPRSAAANDTSGRGLALVDVLASTWGVDLNGRGKEVWFELTL